MAARVQDFEDLKQLELAQVHVQWWTFVEVMLNLQVLLLPVYLKTFME
jgi:hypothetical protein